MTDPPHPTDHNSRLTPEARLALTDFLNIHTGLGHIFENDGITEEDRMRLSAQLTIATQIKSLEVVILQSVQSAITTGFTVKHPDQKESTTNDE